MFEYTSAIASGPIPDSEMNKFGNDGWELVSMTTFPSRVGTVQFLYTFKRFKSSVINTPIPAVS